MVKTKVLKKKGQKPISFHPGGLHRSLGVAQGKPIPPGKKAAALAGKYGKKAKKQAAFAQNVLTGPKGPKRPKRRLLVKKGARVIATKRMQKLMGMS